MSFISLLSLIKQNINQKGNNEPRGVMRAFFFVVQVHMIVIIIIGMNIIIYDSVVSCYMSCICQFHNLFFFRVVP